VTSLGQLYSLIAIWLQARIEERRVAHNLQENLALMTLTARIQSRQGLSLARENSALSRKLAGLPGFRPEGPTGPGGSFDLG
jgi:hypothetical protein